MVELAETYAKLYPDFKPAEFACRCHRQSCKRHGMEFIFLATLQELRSKVGFPLLVHSGWRCSTWNTAIGGALNSKHLEGMAADIGTRVLSGNEKHKLLSEGLQLFSGVGVYPDFFHFDLRPRDLRTVWAF